MVDGNVQAQVFPEDKYYLQWKKLYSKVRGYGGGDNNVNIWGGIFMVKLSSFPISTMINYIQNIE